MRRRESINVTSGVQSTVGVHAGEHASLDALDNLLDFL